MRKKLLLITISMLVLLFVGCNDTKDAKTNEDTMSEQASSETTETNDSTKVEQSNTNEDNYYKAGESVDLTDNRGTYKFKVISAQLLPKNKNRDKVVQVTYEYENVNFTGYTHHNGTDVKDIVIIDSSALKVKDSNKNILHLMSSAWEGEWQEAIPAKAGEKCTAKYTFSIDTDNNDYVYVSFPRLEKDFKVELKRN
ncbi:hypothetical protein [Clostridium sp. HBUAS56017]|uniref:hypothetical protein n=1 Tax=Clostridium sp. HBUAS56017 TaxID=2571128 RepID=UPI0011786527|nr:hypothetical protein [Clostridium sp. HBUAS56017]